jgi:hypothetical protein
MLVRSTLRGGVPVKKALLSAAMAGVLCGAAGSAVSAAGAIVGYVSDEKCAMSGSKASTAAEWIKPDAFEACVKDCLKEGAEPVFVTEDNKILKFDAASKKKIESFVGHKVSVTGKVQGTTITVDSIAALKMK